MTFRHKLPLFVLSLACLACVPAAHAQCAVSGVPVFSGAPINPDAYGNMFYTETGGSGSVSIQFTAASGCTYFVASDSSWLTTSVNSPTINQSASMTVTFTVAFNNANFRTGHLTVYVNGFSVNSVAIDQNSLACQLVITSANPISFPSGGGTATLTFNTGGCLYVGPNFSSSWMNVATGGLGPSAVTFNVLPNTGQPRSGTVSFSSPPGQILTVNQAGTGTAPALTLNCSPVAGPTLVGLYYAASCNGGGGVPPYTWSLATFTSCGNACSYYGQLPQGIGFNSNGATAQFTGTPTTAGPYLYGPLMTDSNGTTATITYSGTIAGGPLALNCVPTTGPTVVGTPYTATCTASGGAPPYTWSITTGLGSLPPNLMLTTNGSTATISGTPTGAGALGYSYILQLADSASATVLQPYTGTLGQGSQAATITSLIPSSATAGGNGFTMTVIGTGFASGAIVNWNSTSLSTSYIDPSQLQAVVASNLIASAGTVPITVTTGNITTSPVNFTINSSTAPLTISCLPATGPAAQGVTYLATCTASGGTTPYNWSIASGALPQGLAPGATTGSSFTISGTPTSTGAYSYAVKVVDSSVPQQTQTQSYSGTITLPPASITSLNCSSGANGPSTVGVWYTDTCTAPNGTAPFSWSISAGALPAGVTLNGSASATAAISGTPTAAGSYSYTLTVSDSSSPAPLSASLAFSGSVAPAGSATLTVAPANLTFSYRPDISPPAAQSLSVFTTATATTFTVAVNAVWLSATPLGGQPPGTISISVNAGTLAPGTYTALVTVNSFNVSPLSVTIPVTLIVQPAPQPQLTLGQTQFAYGLTQGSAPTQGQVLVMNSGGGVLSFTTAVTGCSCVSVSTSSGQATPGAPAAVAFTVNPVGLPAATYNSQIVITPSVGQPVTVPVTIAVNSLTQSIVLTQNGLLFGSVAQGAAPPSQSFNVLNAGQGLMSFTLTTQTLAGGPGWLSVNPSSSSVAAGSISTPVTVSVNPAGLAAGQYYGLVQVVAANAGNSPQVVSVLLNVVDPSQGAILASPTGVLVGPASGTVTLYNLSTQPISYVSTISTTDGGNWLLATPSTGTVPAQSSVQVTVSGNASLLPSGTGQGVVRFGFSTGAVQSVAVSSLGSSLPGAGSCQSSYLVPTVIGPIGPSFTVTQAQPVSLNVSVVDNCNNIIPLAAVTANFSDKDPSIALVPQGNGIWSGTWTPKTAQPQISVGIVATAKGIAGTFQLTGTVQPAANAEAPAPAAALNSANVSGAAQISPGTWMTIFGDRLANGTSSASGTFPPSLAGTSVMIGAMALPLDYVSPTQVNALLPFSLTPNAIVSLVVQRSATVSVPIDVTIADIGPAIFAVNGVGTGQGAVTIATSGVLAAPVGAFPGSQPVKRGDFLAIYCTGLGAVSNTPADGAPAPSSPPLATTLANPSVTIGGAPAVVSYSGLAPGLVGLYQVNVQVPDNAPTGNAVNLAITVGSLTSNTVTVAVQ